MTSVRLSHFITTVSAIVPLVDLRNSLDFLHIPKHHYTLAKQVLAKCTPKSWSVCCFPAVKCGGQCIFGQPLLFLALQTGKYTLLDPIDLCIKLQSASFLHYKPTLFILLNVNCSLGKLFESA